MRCFDQRRDGLFSYVRPESRIPKNHPLRVIRKLADEAPTSLNDQFAALYAESGRPSIPPEQLLRALLVQAFYTIRSERQLMEQLNYNLLFRWFVGLSVDQGCSMLWYSNQFEQVVDATECGAVTILTDGACLVGLEDVEGETTQAGEHAGVGANAAAVLAKANVTAVV